MKVVNFSESDSIVSKFIAELRDVNIQNDRMRFRRNVERIGEMMAYEVSKTLHYEGATVTTPFGISEVSLPADQIVAGTILRAGLPLHSGVLKVFDDAENAFVSAYRKYDDDINFDIHIEYIASPALDGKVLLLCDPMLATGGSMELAYEALLTKGTPEKVHILSVIASREAVDYVAEHFPEDTTLWVGAIDEFLDPHKYILPGLGDAGDLSFGEKE